MKNYIIEKREDFVFGPKIEKLEPVYTSTTECFDRIDNEITLDKMKWSNCTDKTRCYDVTKTTDRVELKVHKSGSRSTVVSTITYTITEI